MTVKLRKDETFKAKVFSAEMSGLENDLPAVSTASTATSTPTPTDLPVGEENGDEGVEEENGDEGVSFVRNITSKSFGKIKKSEIPLEGMKKIGTIVGVIDVIKEVPNTFNPEETQLKLSGVFSAVSVDGVPIEEANTCYLPSIGEDAIRYAMNSETFKLPLEFAMALFVIASVKSPVGYTYVIKPLHQSKPPSRLKDLLRLAHSKS